MKELHGNQTCAIATCLYNKNIRLDTISFISLFNNTYIKSSLKLNSYVT